MFLSMLNKTQNSCKYVRKTGLSLADYLLPFFNVNITIVFLSPIIRILEVAQK